MINSKIEKKKNDIFIKITFLMIVVSMLLGGCANVPPTYQGAMSTAITTNMEHQEQKKQTKNFTTNTNSQVVQTSDRQLKESNITNTPSEVNRGNVRANSRQTPGEQKKLGNETLRTSAREHKTNMPQVVDTETEFLISSCHAPIEDYKKIPLVMPKPDYISPNESQIVEAQGHRPVSAFDLLKHSTSSYINIKLVLSEWERALSTAEYKFWSYYDQHGKVNPALRDEFGYWLHRRETWQAARNKISLELGPQYAKNYNFFLKGFSRPPEFTWKSIDFVILQQPLDKLIESKEYIDYFKKLSNNSFLKNSACSPEKSPDPLDQITAKLIFPFAEISSYDSEVLKQVEVWKTNQQGDIYGLLDYINKLPNLYQDKSYDIRSEILKYLSEPVNITDEKKHVYMNRMKGEEKEISYKLKYREEDFKTRRELTIPSIDSSISSEPRKRFAHITPTSKRFTNIALTFDELISCANNKFLEAIDFLYERNPERSHNLAMQVSLEGTYFRSEAVYLAYIVCLSDQGFSDSIIPLRLKRFGL